MNRNTAHPASSWRSPSTPARHAEADRAYGALATYVADHALALDGPIREYYLTGSHETPDQVQWQTEIGWPIVHIGAAP